MPFLRRVGPDRRPIGPCARTYAVQRGESCTWPNCTCEAPYVAPPLEDTYLGVSRPITLDYFEVFFVLIGWGAAFFILGIAYGISHP